MIDRQPKSKVEFVSMRSGVLALSGRSVFLSSSIPSSARWEGNYDAMEITHAVVACARAVLSVGGTIVTAAHPTISPLLLYVAGEFPRISGQAPSIIVYQSRLFEEDLPVETSEMAKGGVADLRWTRAVRGDDQSDSRKWGRSLFQMRLQMLTNESPFAAVFIGGMEGILAEHRLFSALHRRKPTYSIFRPGGEAANLVFRSPQPIVEALMSELSYPTIFHDVVNNMLEHLDIG